MNENKLDTLINNIGERSSYFLAGAYFDSLCDVLTRTFGVTRCLAKLQKHDGQQKRQVLIEIDALAYNKETVVIVEVVETLTKESLWVLREKLATFKTLFTEHAAKNLVGIIAARKPPEAKEIERAGREEILVALIQADEFVLPTQLGTPSNH